MHYKTYSSVQVKVKYKHDYERWNREDVAGSSGGPFEETFSIITSRG
jgi:hypothetical protein